MFFLDWHCEKKLQSLGYSIFAKTSGHFHTFCGVYAEAERLEGTLVTSNALNFARSNILRFFRNKYDISGKMITKIVFLFTI